MKFTLFTADVTGVASNCQYPHPHEIDNAKTLAEAAAFDNVCGRFKNDYRNGENFLGCDCVMMDCDNDHTEVADEWMTPEKFSAENPDVAFAAVPSRNNMKEKKGRAARPKHHYIFPIAETADKDYVANLKAAIQAEHPIFDNNALDAARFAFGAKCGADEVFWQDGWLTIDEVVDAVALEDDIPDRKEAEVIPKG